MDVSMKVMNCKVMKVSLELLFQMALNHCQSDDFPEDSKLVSMDIDHIGNTLKMKISSDSFTDTLEGGLFPSFRPNFNNIPIYIEKENKRLKGKLNEIQEHSDNLYPRAFIDKTEACKLLNDFVHGLRDILKNEA